MPEAAFEMAFGRVVFWFSLLINIGLAVLMSAAAVSGFTGQSTWSTPTNVLITVLAVWWWVLCVDLYVLVLYRPRRARSSLESVNLPVANGVLVPGSRRLVAITLVLAVATVAVLGSAMVAAEGAWVIVIGVFAVAMLAVVVDFAVSSARPRELLLTPEGITATTFRRQASIAWDDFSTITFVQGMGGVMVFRITPMPGASSYSEQWIHPFATRKRTIDIEPVTLDLDPLLLMLALRTYREAPGLRKELSGTQVPLRLTDPTFAVPTGPDQVTGYLLTIYKPERT